MPTVLEQAQNEWVHLGLRAFNWLWCVCIFSVISDQLTDPVLHEGTGSVACWFGFTYNAESLEVSSSKSTCSFGFTVAFLSWLIDMAMTLLILWPAFQPQFFLPTWVNPAAFGTHALFLLFWVAQAMNSAVKYTVTCTTLDDFAGLGGKSCKDTAGTRTCTYYRK